MRYLLCFVLCMLILSPCLKAAEDQRCIAPPAPVETFTDSDYAYGDWDGARTWYKPWGYNKPENADRIYPIVVFGRHNEAELYFTTELRKKYPAFYVSFNKSYESDGEELADLIDERMANHNYRIDVNRIYLTGFSAGGSASFSLARGMLNKGKCFAAILRIAGQSQTYLDHRGIDKISLWMHIGLLDTAYRVQVAREIYSNIKNDPANSDAIETIVVEPEYPRTTWVLSRNGNDFVRYSEYPDMYHDPQTPYTDPYLYEWMFTKAIKPAASANTAPVVNSGSDQSIALPAEAVLNGSVTDDGLPSGSAVACTWSKVSGPGDVSFSKITDPITTASFSVPGTYVLTLTASDGELAGKDNIVITVTPELTGEEQTIFVDMGNIDTEGNWNNLSAPFNGFIQNAIDSSGNPTGISFAVTNSFEWSNDLGSTNEGGIYPITAQQDSFPVYSVGGEEALGIITVSGLNPETEYDIELFGSRKWTGGAVTQYTVNGQIKNLAVYENTSDTVVFSGMSTVTGSMDIEVRPASGSDTGYLGVIKIVTHPTGGTNRSPAVNAGDDIAITLPAQASLAGTVTDDGLPEGGVVASSWSKVSGPGDVTFADAANSVTTASFAAPGTYVLRLTATDGELNSQDEVTITVTEEVIVPESEILVDLGDVDTAGNWNNLSMPINGLIENAIDSSGNLTGISFEVTKSFNWTDNQGFTEGGIFPATAQEDSFPVYSSAGEEALGILTVSGLDPEKEYDIELFASRKWNAAVVSSYTINGSSQDLALYNNAVNSVVFSSLSSSSGTLDIEVRPAEGSPAGYLGVIKIVTRPTGGTNRSPAVNAGDDIAITLPAQASLAGTVTNDDLPEGEVVASSWSKVSGPGDVTFTDAANSVTTASFAAPGTYVLRLTATDGELNSQDEVTITVTEEVIVQESEILVDLGDVDTAGNWNNLSMPINGLIENAIDSSGNLTGISFEVTKSFNWTDNQGFTEGGIFPATAQEDSFPVYSSTGEDALGILTVSGLDPEKEYDIELFASRKWNAAVVSSYTINGSSQDLALYNNAVNSVVFSSLSSSSGTLDIEVRPAEGSPAGYLGVIRIVARQNAVVTGE